MMISEAKGTSPLIERLRRAILTGDKGALERFWRSRSQNGAPLIEKLAGDSTHSLVTFVWRGTAIEQVSLVSLLTTPTRNPLERLLDTDLCYKTCHVRDDVLATYQFEMSTSSQSDSSGWANLHRDPLNPLTFEFFDEMEDPTGVKLTRSVLRMPAAPAQPWGEERPEMPRGQIELHMLSSTVLKNERRLWVFTPPGYLPQGDQAYSLVIFFDGWGYIKLMPTTTIFVNLMAMDRIQPSIVVFVDSLGLDVRMRELILNPAFNQFVAGELLPWIRKRYPVTQNASQVVAGGASAGGLAAAYLGLEHPELVGNVLSQSGAFSFSPEGDPEYEWLSRQFTERGKMELNFHLDAGLLETRSLRERGDAPNLLVANRHLRDVLTSKGYPVHYTEFSGGHDYVSWQGVLPVALQALIGIR